MKILIIKAFRKEHCSFIKMFNLNQIIYQYLKDDSQSKSHFKS